jgi:hypothetical protein
MAIQLEAKDRSLVSVCGLAVFIVLLAAWWVPSGPRRAYAQSMQALAAAQAELETTQLMKAEETMRIESQQSIREALRVRPASFNFFTLVDQTLTEAQLKERAELNRARAGNQDTPQEMLELRLSGVSLEELVDFLHRIYEKNSLVAVYQMNFLRPARDGRGLECNITLATIKPVVQG